MGTKTIRVSETAYERLAARKREGESFSDVIERLTDDQPDIYAGFGAWEGTDKGDNAREAADELNADVEATATEYARRKDE
ncbi:hypothetical protein BRC81_08845 [Halobacteriales archaeon QS_1_68_20]|nr:MAG: hypothetical protein BRC81_08845 [Halobacteriales archaeon QS_1_68_20]